MSRSSDMSVLMIERSLSDISKSAYPSAEYTLGIVELAYRLGNVSEDEYAKYTQAAFNAVTARRQALRREDAERRKEEALSRLRLAS